MFYRHTKRGTVYRLINIGIQEASLEPVVIYSDVNTGAIWVRPAREFFDGRFVVYTGGEESPLAALAAVH